MHIIVLAEGFGDQLEKFVKWVKSRRYDNYSCKRPDWGVKVREFKILDIICSKGWEKPLLEDLMHFERRIGNPWRIRIWLDKLQNHPMVKFLKNALKIKTVDKDSVTPSTTDKIGNIDFSNYVYVIGELPDEQKGNLEMI